MDNTAINSVAAPAGETSPAPYTRDNLEKVMSNEDSGKKCCLAICSGIHFCLALIAGIILGLRWSNAHAIAEASTGAGDFYDQLPAYYY